MGSIQFYDHTNIDDYIWPDTKDGKKAKDYLLPLIKGKVESFIDNVSTQIALIVCNNIILPVSINNAEYHNSYIASNYYGISFYDEYMQKKHPFFSKLQKPLIIAGKWLLKKIEVNKCIFFNNWLLTNTIQPKLEVKDLREIIFFLRNSFPQHVFIYRNIETLLKKDLLSALKENKFHLLKTRNVFMYDPSRKHNLSSKALSHHRKDKKIQEKYGFTIVRDFGENDIKKMLELYEKVYIQNHTPFSPKYKKEFLQNAVENKIFHFVGVKKDNQLEGIMGYLIRDQTMITPFFGFNTDAEYSGELYRFLSILILEEAEKNKAILNDGSGGEKTKKYRGLVPYSEFMGVYSHHLPWGKKFFWNALSFIYRRFG